MLHVLGVYFAQYGGECAVALGPDKDVCHRFLPPFKDASHAGPCCTVLEEPCFRPQLGHVDEFQLEYSFAKRPGQWELGVPP